MYFDFPLYIAIQVVSKISHASTFVPPLKRTLECGIQNLRSSSTDVLPVIYCYQLLILLLKTIVHHCNSHMVGTIVVSLSKYFVVLYVINISFVER